VKDKGSRGPERGGKRFGRPPKLDEPGASDDTSLIIDWIRGHVRAAALKPEITPDTPLLDGLFDSLDVVELGLFLEDRFGISLPAEEMTPEHLETPARVAAMVRRARASGSG
jgi:acyl carrier protein